MKKQLGAFVVLAASTAATAQTSVTLYGRVDGGIEYLNHISNGTGGTATAVLAAPPQGALSEDVFRTQSRQQLRQARGGPLDQDRVNGTLRHDRKVRTLTQGGYE